MILKAGLVDAPQNQFNILRRYPQLWKQEELYKLRPNSYIKPLKLISLLLIKPFYNRFLALVNESKVNDSLPNISRFKHKIGMMRFFGTRPLLWQPHTTMSFWVPRGVFRCFNP